jgi:hypothetical protein
VVWCGVVWCGVGSSPVLNNGTTSGLHSCSLLSIIKTMHAVHVDCFTAFAEHAHAVAHIGYGEHVAEAVIDGDDTRGAREIIIFYKLITNLTVEHMT